MNSNRPELTPRWNSQPPVEISRICGEWKPEQHPDERVAWASTGGETHHAGAVTFHKLTDSSTRVTVQLDWAPEGLIEKAGSLIGVGSHAVKKDLENFKEFIESRGRETGAWRGDVDA